MEIVPDAPPTSRATVFVRDDARSVISRNTSPDIPFDLSLNPYRGCEHGCAYCYARIFHEYLGFSAGLDFETTILVKEDAPTVLERELGTPGYTPRPLQLSGVTDPYQPVERRLRLTRRCLEVLARHGHPVTVVTKNAAVTRDADLLGALASSGAAMVWVSLTTLDADLARRLEPRTSTPQARLEAIRNLAGSGVPAGVLVAPVIPGLTDHEIPSILEAAAGAGARWAQWTPLRLPGAVRAVFTDWLESHQPYRATAVLRKLREMRGGRLDDPRFHHRFRGQGHLAAQLDRLFQVTCRRLGLEREPPPLDASSFRPPGGRQPSLFDVGG